MNNPYDKLKQEAKYLSWDAGFNSLTKDDNPYEDQQDDEEAAKLSGIWMQGFNANKNRPKPVKVKPVQIEEPVTINGGLYVIPPTSDLSNITTEILLQEVAKRMKDFEETVKRFKKIMG